jgi:TetR/AcrR family transcriptional regulator
MKRLTESKQKEIIQTGIAEFAKLGYDGANINVIAKKAGISVGVLYKYYESKEAFFLACVRKSLETLHQLLDPEGFRGLQPEEAAGKLVQAAVNFSRDSRDEVLLYHQITNWEQGEKTRELAREIEGDSSSIYVQLMRSFQERGMLRTDVKPEYLAMFFDNLLMMLQFSGSCTYYDERWRLYCGKTDKEELAAQMIRMLAGFFRNPDEKDRSGDADPVFSEKKNGGPDR